MKLKLRHFLSTLLAIIIIIIIIIIIYGYSDMGAMRTVHSQICDKISQPKFYLNKAKIHVTAKLLQSPQRRTIHGIKPIYSELINVRS
jgi:hypothetical protein